MLAKIETPESKLPDELYVAGIGASAGGLDAIQELFKSIRPDTGLAFVVIQHLSPDYKSLMAEILSKHTSMQVFEAEDGMQVSANCVYLTPSKKIMTIKDGKLLLEDKIKNKVPNMAIDHFLESLALDKGKFAIGIILSGTGTDGTKGVEAIKDNGGVVIVQDPMSAEFDGMPNSAIATGYADLILPPEMIGDELLEFLKESPIIKSFNALDQKEQLTFYNILELIKVHTGHDFSLYKKPTLSRRLAKRIAEKGCTSLDDYYKLLKSEPEEANAISKEFLINVTKFFRDTEAFELLRVHALPSIFQSKKPGDSVKIWVVACSSGEEAYSIGILAQEYITSNSLADVTVKIFATDIDQEALNAASKGSFPPEALKSLPDEYVNKYFVKEGNEYIISPVVRKMIVFAKHNISKDPPFSKIDLLSCRNMLIYMSTALQKSIIKKFHFALNEGGYLLLGPSENLGSMADYFKDIDKKWKLYKCVIKSQPFDHENYIAPIVKESIAKSIAAKSKNALNNIAEIFKDTLLEEYKYAGIFIDKDFEVKQAIGNFKNFMSFPDDRLNFNLLKLVCPDLAITLGMAVRKAIKDNERVIMKGIKIIEGKLQREINLIVKPYMAQREYMQPFLFIIIEEVHTQNIKIEIPLGDKATAERILELETELRDLRENLQAVIEEVETANEELQSSNEEIVSANEELQSTNEELQSLNEELHTVNSEYQLKIKELTELSDDQNNYFLNSDIGQIFIDKNLTIRKFTPAATRQINMIDSDIGRSISSFSTNFRRLDFVSRIKEVINTNNDIEQEVLMVDNKTYLMRITPYIRQDKTIDGVVASFADITETKRLSNIIEATFNSSPNAILALRSVRDNNMLIKDFEVVALNNNVHELLHKEGEKLKTGSLLKEDIQQLANYFDELIHVVSSGQPFHAEYLDIATYNWLDIAVVKMMDGLVATMCDITQKKNAANMLIQSYDELKRTSSELLSANERLEQSNYDLVQFASVASHDLKEPLRKILVFGNFLKDKLYNNLGPEEKNYMDKIIGSSLRMQDLIEDVLTLSKLSNNDNTSIVSTDLNEIIRQIIDDIDITVKEKNATIEYKNLPVIDARPGQMRQLFQNLISNSLKFCKESPHIIIRQAELTSADAGNLMLIGQEYCCVEVSDNGIGFDQVYSEKIFGLFQRLNGNIYKGTGLGLAICKKIVENHGGTIKVRSHPNEGATFKIILPVTLLKTEYTMMEASNHK